MPRYPLPDLNSLPADIQEKILEVQEKSGFIPQVFLALARHGTLAAAGGKVGLDASTVSRRLAGLEEAVGTALFDRTRDGVALTGAGEQLLGFAEELERSAIALTHAAESLEAAPAGTVRVTAPPLMVDAYHEFDHPVEMLASLRSALKPKGRIYLLEYRAEDDNVPIKPHHKMTEAQARREFEAAGFRFVTNKPGLPWQHLLIFEKP
jgi:hypothetical protein